MYAKFTCVNAVVMVQNFEQTGPRTTRAKFTFPVFWEMSWALIEGSVLRIRPTRLVASLS